MEQWEGLVKLVKEFYVAFGRDDGKILKGDGYSRPNTEQFIERKDGI